MELYYIEKNQMKELLNITEKYIINKISKKKDTAGEIKSFKKEIRNLRKKIEEKKQDNIRSWNSDNLQNLLLNYDLDLSEDLEELINDYNLIALRYLNSNKNYEIDKDIIERYDIRNYQKKIINSISKQNTISRDMNI